MQVPVTHSTSTVALYVVHGTCTTGTGYAVVRGRRRRRWVAPPPTPERHFLPKRDCLVRVAGSSFFCTCGRGGWKRIGAAWMRFRSKGERARGCGCGCGCGCDGCARVPKVLLPECLVASSYLLLLLLLFALLCNRRQKRAADMLFRV